MRVLFVPVPNNSLKNHVEAKTCPTWSVLAGREGEGASLCTTHVNENWGAIIIKPVKRSTIKIRVHTEGQPQRESLPTLLLSLTLSLSLSLSLYLLFSNISAPGLGTGCWSYYYSTHTSWCLFSLLPPPFLPWKSCSCMALKLRLLLPKWNTLPLHYDQKCCGC